MIQELMMVFIVIIIILALFYFILSGYYKWENKKMVKDYNPEENKSKNTNLPKEELINDEN